MERHGGDIYNKSVNIDFSVSVNPFGIPDKVRKEAMRGVELSEHYPDINTRILLEKMEANLQISKENIVLGAGAVELIYGMVHAMRPKRALIFGPTFAEYERALEGDDIKYDYVLAKRKDEFEFQAEILDQLSQNKYDMVFICNPNNPTGKLMKKKLLQAVADYCEKQKIILVLDECFMDFVKKGGEHSFIGRVSDYQYVVVLKAFTKLFSMPGLRLGFAVTGNSKISKMLKKVLPPWNISVPAQFAGVAALSEADYVQRTKEYIVRERRWLEENLSGLGFKVYPSKTNFILFEGPKGVQKHCMSRRILIRNAGSFWGMEEGFYRIGVKLHHENEKLLEVLKELTEEIAAWQQKKT